MKHLKTYLQSVSLFLNNFAFKEIKILLSFLIVVAGVWIFLELANEVNAGTTQQFDEFVLSMLREGEDLAEPIGPQWVSVFFRDITALGGGVVLTIIVFIVAGYFVLSQNYRALILVLIAAIIGAVIDSSLKDIYMRTRPNIVIHLAEVTSYSFPSGHSMMSAVIYLSLAVILARNQTRLRIRIYVISVALLLTFTIGISRIFLGVHYPTDVIGGWSIGLAWASLCWFGAWYFEKRRTKKLEKKEPEET